MRPPVAKAVRDEFAARLMRHLSQFREASGEIPAGDRLFQWAASPQIRFFLLLQIHRHEDWFTVEAAISHSGQWPAQVIVPNTPEEYDGHRDVRFRLGRLWAPPQTDVWWELVPRPPAGASFEEYARRVPIEAVLARVVPAVDDAVGRVQIHAMPYFTRILENAAHQAP